MKLYNDLKGKKKSALVLSGGGALGAYEVGVMDYIFNDLARDYPFRPDILTGTSVGAINSVFLAANAHKPFFNINQLIELWENITFSTVFKLGPKELLKTTQFIMGTKKYLFRKASAEDFKDIKGLLDTSPLLEFANKAIDWKDITRNINEGLLHALCITATELNTGDTTVFMQKAFCEMENFLPAIGIHSENVEIGLDHVLASAAIPIIFPAIKIGESFYYDGGIRQNTPLRPALHNGADKIIVISFNPRYRETPSTMFNRVKTDYPGLGFILGKLIQAVLNDNIQADVARINRFNRFFKEGTDIFGEDFLERLNKQALQEGRPEYRMIDTVLIQPSVDLSDIAREILNHRPASYISTEDFIIDFLSNRTGMIDYDLISYLFFSAKFTKRLIELGRSDAAQYKDELIQLITT